MSPTHLNHLQAVQAVLRLGTFRAAAGALGITPAALGQRIRTLEAYAGRRLFERHADGVRPTAATLGAAEDLAAGFAALGAAFEALTASPPENRISLTITQSVAENWLPRQLPDFLQRAEPVDLRMDTSRAFVDLRGAADFDFALRFSETPGPGHEGTALFRGCVAPVCTPDFATRYGLVPGRRDLEGIPLIHLDDPTADPAWPDWMRWCDAFGLAMPAGPPSGAWSRLTSGSRLARAGMGLVLCGVIEALPALRDGDLILPFGPDLVQRTAFSYWLTWRAGQRLTRLQRTFRDWLEDRAAAERAHFGPFLEAV